jgi:hypothetical protein
MTEEEIKKWVARVKRANDARLAPWEQAYAADKMLAAMGAEKTAELLGVSEQHARNLARIAKKLTAASWSSFVRLGHTARIGAWLKIAAATPEEQRRLVREQESSVNPYGDFEPPDPAAGLGGLEAAGRGSPARPGKRHCEGREGDRAPPRSGEEPGRGTEEGKGRSSGARSRCEGGAAGEPQARVEASAHADEAAADESS